MAIKIPLKMIIINPHNPIFPPLLRQWMLIVLFTFVSTSLKAVNDTLKKKQPVYDLNDPRNPNCPCHKYQKLADEEFLKQKKPIDQFVVQSADIQKNNVRSYAYMSRKNVILEEFPPKPRELNFNSARQPNRTVTRYKKVKKNEGKIKSKLVISKFKFKIYKMFNNRRKAKFSKNYNNCFTWH
ncbi:MAG: hypothetical protein WBM13_08970 [Bacteroidia bacterium]